MGNTYGNTVQISSAFGKFFIGLAAVLLVVFTYISAKNIYNQYFVKTDAKADGFLINSYEVEMTVGKDNVIEVEERINVYFYEWNHRGIVRFLPEWLKYTDKNGHTMSRRSIISKLKCINKPYTVDYIGRKKRLKMGLSSVTVGVGDQEYDLSYKYDMGKDPYKGFDEFIFHAFGDYWGTQITNPTIIINFEKGISGSNSIHFYADKYRSQDISSYVNYEINGNTLVANVNPSYNLNSALTVDVEFPEGYFEGEHNNYSYLSLIFLLAIIGYAILVFVLWYRFGKDLPDEEVSSEFYPPYGLDASQIGYIYKGKGDKLTVAIIVELAAKGYIEIIETDSKFSMKAVKVKDPIKDISEMTKNELLVYTRLFRNGDEVDLINMESRSQTICDVNENVRVEFQDKMNDIHSYKLQSRTAAGLVFAIIIWYLVYYFEKLNPAFSFLYLLGYIALIVTLVCVLFMSRKSSYGEKLTAKVLSYRNYLENVEKEKIEMLAEEHPNYFFDILPYAYVLGVSKKWISKLEVENTTETAYVYHMDRIYDSMTYAQPGSSSGGSSGCGGGCSSCGGGCSSCGGGGSW